MDSKNVVLCGASQGLGAVIARKFYDQNWNVIILDLLEPSNSKMQFYQCDVTDFEATKKCIDEITQKYQAIDGLVNCIRYRNKENKGISFHKEWERGMEIDLHTYFNASLLVCNRMKTIEKDCSIVNISSVLSDLVSTKESINYHMAKAAINQMTRYLAVEFGPYNIRVNSVLPGLISNHESEKSSTSPSASLYSRGASHIPLRRSGAPEEVAELVLFLVSSLSSYITGQNIVIDGGLALREQFDVFSDILLREK